MEIHPTAIVDPAARLGPGVEVGPYALIGAGVSLGPRCRIGPHACLQGPLAMGEACVVGFSAAIGHEPQVKAKAGPWGGTRIGARNVFREFSQVHRSMLRDGFTVIGDDGYFMANAHVAHDCTLGNHVVVCNNAAFSGHVAVGDRAFVSGQVAVHQFARIGEGAMVGGLTTVSGDVPPFGLVIGARPARLVGLNVVGLRRAGCSAEARLALKRAFKTLFRSDLPLPRRLEEVPIDTPEVERLVAFLRASRRGVIGFGGAARGDD
ncbi:MAG: acyl-ACP--UDP-N-acetylglucosamine O-acyltransferase [Planctomycetaceae bacterium]